MAVALDVGGLYFKTSISTLSSFPDSFFGRMFSGDWQNEKDEHGGIFIDRDGELFKYVVDFLRNGVKMVLPDDQKTRELLKVEADFYCLHQLAELLEGEVVLNVGGKCLKTTVRTLISFPDSFFGRMFRGNWQNAKDEHGQVFIDRDGDVFKYVLDFLTNGRNMLLPDNKRTKRKIKVEAEFYLLPELVKLTGIRKIPHHWPPTGYNPEAKMARFLFRDPELPHYTVSLFDLRRFPDSYFSQLADKIDHHPVLPFQDEYCLLEDGDFILEIPEHSGHNVVLLLKFLELGPIAIMEKDIKGDIRDLLYLTMMLNLEPAVEHVQMMVAK